MPLTKSHGFVLAASLGFSFILIFSTLLKESGVSSFEQVFLRVTLGAVLLLIILRGKVVLFNKSDLSYFAFTGFVFAAFLLSGLSAIVFDAPIAVAAGLINTQPIFTTILACALRKENISLKKLGIILVGIVGAFLVTGITPEQIRNLEIGLGVILSLSSGALYAVYLFLKRQKQSCYAPLHLLFNVFLFAVPCTLIMGTILTSFSNYPKLFGFTVPDYYQLSLLFLFAVFSTIVPYGMLNKVNPAELSPTTEGTILLLDPVLHVVWALLLFQQYVNLFQYVGIFLVLLTALLVTKIGHR
ncbi:MAG: DMT family transporter [Candidatus Bathyarchaeia archaeon]